MRERDAWVSELTDLTDLAAVDRALNTVEDYPTSLLADVHASSTEQASCDTFHEFWLQHVGDNV